MIVIDGLVFLYIQVGLVAIGAMGAIALLVLKKVNPKIKTNEKANKRWKAGFVIALGCIVIGELLLWLW